jgi:UDP-2,3-diacylglucosamine pyrophosphatase LpxH
MDVNQETTDLLMSNYSGFDLIHGHTHRQKTHIEKNIQGTYLVTGQTLKVTQ